MLQRGFDGGQRLLRQHQEFGFSHATLPSTLETVILIVKSALHLPLLAVLACLLAGCGQKGPLYLPTKPAAKPAAATAPQAAQPAASEESAAGQGSAPSTATQPLPASR
ncbi:LPS translocon maturation chaperone LptM [Noviherbaspirillum sp.]|uniref:LPS translocon maturation chaperone LptM n=1 Tax=Noviherbaspirillum sp. TaxID=1926288 RepID=UPI0032C21866